MALANVAWILASRGERVLAIDWDLEAPGLHRYFQPFIDDKELVETPGLIDWLLEFADGARSQPSPTAADWFKPYASVARHAFSLEYEFPGEGTLDLLPAGRQGPGYAKRVTTFDWAGFYEDLGGGVFLEALKRNLRAEYDYILIDSRTGISDTSGVCTIQIPDQLVVCFTLNKQSIVGAAAVAESAFEQRKTPSGKPGLRIWPVPTRVELAERERLEQARDVVRQRYQKFLHHLSRTERASYWGGVEVLYQPYFAYEEVLATLIERRGQTGSLLQSFERITSYLTDGEIAELGATPTVAPGTDYETFDGAMADARFYVSYAKPDEAIAERLVEGLRGRLGRSAVLWDRDLLRPGDDWAQILSRAINQADAVLPVLTLDYLEGRSAPREALYAVMRGMRVVPVFVGPDFWVRAKTTKSPLLKELTRFHGVELRTANKKHFESDMQTLAQVLRETVALSKRRLQGRGADSDDPLRGQFGGRSQRDGWHLWAHVATLGDGWFNIELRVAGTADNPLFGAVEFHLHPTFDPAVQVVSARDGVAELQLHGWGAFTVGAVVLASLTPLELDLASVKGAPQQFRES